MYISYCVYNLGLWIHNYNNSLNTKQYLDQVLITFAAKGRADTNYDHTDDEDYKIEDNSRNSLRHRIKNKDLRERKVQYMRYSIYNREEILEETCEENRHQQTGIASKRTKTLSPFTATQGCSSKRLKECWISTSAEIWLIIKYRLTYPNERRRIPLRLNRYIYIFKYEKNK